MCVLNACLSVCKYSMCVCGSCKGQIMLSVNLGPLKSGCGVVLIIIWRVN